MTDTPSREGRTFPVETRFQKLARRPGGLPRAQAIEAAEAKIEESKPEFETWLDRELQDLVDLTATVRDGSAKAHWVEELSSHCRQLRDIGTTMGYTLLTFIANNLCDILENPNRGLEGNLEMITCHIDALLLARKAQYRNLRPEQLPELSGGLRRVAQFVRTSVDGTAK
jgi:hypothetical protein